MRIVDRYIIRELLVSFFFAVFTLNLVLVVGQIFKKLFEFTSNHNIPATYIITIIVSLLPVALVYSIPWGFLTAVLLVFGRLSAGNELTALRTAGLSIMRIASPVMLLAVACSALCLWIDLYVAPRAQQNLQIAFVQMATSNPSAAFTGDQVINDFPNRRIYIGSKDGDRLENVHVFELNENNQPEKVVFARAGTLKTDTEHNQIIMTLTGSRYEQRDYQQPSDLTKIHDGVTVETSSLPISLDELFAKKQGRRKVEFYNYQELREMLEAKRKQLKEDKRALDKSHDDQLRKTVRSDIAQVTAATTELNKRFSFSLACVTLALIGIPLGITAQRQETSVGFGLSLVVALAYFSIIIVVNALREKAQFHPEILIWLPNAIFLLLGGVLFYRLSRR